METMFGLTREVLLVYSPHRDLQFRTFQALPELINGLPRQVTQGLALVCSPDSRQAEKLDDWSTSRLLAVPITNNPDGLEDSGRALLNCLQQRIFTRDLYAETAPVRGSDFFGRRRILLQSLPNDVDEGRVFGVFGLRKSGKTSILKRVGEELVAHRLRRPGRSPRPPLGSPRCCTGSRPGSSRTGPRLAQAPANPPRERDRGTPAVRRTAVTAPSAPRGSREGSRLGRPRADDPHEARPQDEPAHLVTADSAVKQAEERLHGNRLGPGDFFGEMALLGTGRRAATVTTTSPARVLVLFGSDFRRLRESHPGIAAQIEAVMERRL
jgi:CRP-like cAMP-binding protein